MKLLRLSCDLEGPFLTLDSEGAADIPERIVYDGQTFAFHGIEGPSGHMLAVGVYDSGQRLYRYRHRMPKPTCPR